MILTGLYVCLGENFRPDCNAAPTLPHFHALNHPTKKDRTSQRPHLRATPGEMKTQSCSSSYRWVRERTSPVQAGGCCLHRGLLLTFLCETHKAHLKSITQQATELPGTCSPPLLLANRTIHHWEWAEGGVFPPVQVRYVLVLFLFYSSLVKNSCTANLTGGSGVT